MLFLRKPLILIFIINILFNGVKSNLKDRSFTIISDSQTNNPEGLFEASGNVFIEGENGTKAYANKLIYDQASSKFRLLGNVIIKNYKTNEIFIEEANGDEFILFTDKKGFQINSNNGHRVKTKLRF
tara:strand:- start:1485 stop:1865 length:381 start_codon:yes stop_codon:yes gene_type:complete